MTDIVHRLRREVTVGSGVVTPLRLEAASEIERLRADLFEAHRRMCALADRELERELGGR